MKDFKKLREQALRQNFRKKEVFVEGDYVMNAITGQKGTCLLYTSPSPRD